MTASKSERLLNLVILLLVARLPVTKERIRESIEDYASATSTEAFEKKFERDKEELRALGLPIETAPIDAYFDDEIGYRIRRDAFELPEIDLAPEEVAVLGLAARVWQHAGMAASTSSALLKLRAAGHDVDRGAIDSVQPALPAEEPFFDDLLRAAMERREARFGYRRSGETTARRRVLQPWGVLTSRRRWYVVGYDVERKDERMFRLSRIEGPVEIGGLAEAFVVPEGVDLQLLARRLTPREETSTARVVARTGAATGLRRQAEKVEEAVEPGWDRLHLRGGSWLVESVLAFADVVRVEAPDSLREEVVRRLRAIVEQAS